MSENKLIEPILIPVDALKEVIAWVKSEQTRTINGDRTFASTRNTKVDWATEVRENLLSLKNLAESDNQEMKYKNQAIQRRIDREVFDNAAEKASNIMHGTTVGTVKACVSFVECTCRNK